MVNSEGWQIIGILCCVLGIALLCVSLGHIGMLIATGDPEDTRLPTIMGIGLPASFLTGFGLWSYRHGGKK